MSLNLKTSLPNPNEVFAVIHVKLNHRDARTFDNYLG